MKKKKSDEEGEEEPEKGEEEEEKRRHSSSSIAERLDARRSSGRLRQRCRIRRPLGEAGVVPPRRAADGLRPLVAVPLAVPVAMSPRRRPAVYDEEEAAYMPPPHPRDYERGRDEPYKRLPDEAGGDDFPSDARARDGRSLSG